VEPVKRPMRLRDPQATNPRTQELVGAQRKEKSTPRVSRKQRGTATEWRLNCGATHHRPRNKGTATVYPFLLPPTRAACPAFLKPLQSELLFIIFLSTALRNATPSFISSYSLPVKILHFAFLYNSILFSFYSIMVLQTFVGPSSLFHYLNLYAVGRTAARRKATTYTQKNTNTK
jgi:hypothetical protein